MAAMVTIFSNLSLIAVKAFIETRHRMLFDIISCSWKKRYAAQSFLI